MHTTSASLLQRLRRPDDPAAWERFVQLYAPLMYYWARHAGLQSQDAADLVQDVLALLLQKLPEFDYDPSRHFRSWLRAVTLNRLRDRARRRADRPIAHGEAGLEEVPVPDGAEVLAEQDYLRHLTRRALEVMRADFAEPTWRACWAVAVEGRPAAEVAAELGMTVGAVHAARFRVLGRLREELQGLLE